MGWVYVIECVPTGEVYIGSTKNSVHKRFLAHQTNMRTRRSSPELQTRYDKHGLASFRFTPLKEFPDEELADREREIIAAVNPTLNHQLTPLAKASRESNPSKRPNKLTISNRARRGLVGAALTASPYANKKRYEVRGEMLTANEIADKYKLNLSTVRQRCSSGLIEAYVRRVVSRAAVAQLVRAPVL